MASSNKPKSSATLSRRPWLEAASRLHASSSLFPFDRFRPVTIMQQAAGYCFTSARQRFRPRPQFRHSFCTRNVIKSGDHHAHCSTIVADRHRSFAFAMPPLRRLRRKTQPRRQPDRRRPRRRSATNESARSSSPRPSARRPSRTCPSRSTPRRRRTSSAPMPPRLRISAATSPALPSRISGRAKARSSVRGVSAGQIVRDQPGVKEQVGVYLDESVDLAVAVHARLRPVRPQPRRNAARPAGHAVRLGQRRRHDPLHHQPAADSIVTEGLGRGQCQHRRRRRHRLSPQGRDQRAARADRRDPRSSATAPNLRASSTRSGRPQARTSTTASRVGRPRLAAVGASARASSITPRVVYQEIRANGFNREEIYNLYANQFTTRRGVLGEREQYLLLREKFTRQDPARRPHRQRRSRPGRADIDHQLHQSRHPGQPRRLGADRLGRRSISASRTRRGELPSNLRRHHRAQAVEPGTSPVLDRQRPVPVGLRRLLFEGRPPIYAAPAHPGLRRRSPTRHWAPAPRRRCRNGFPANSPYNADLPYDIKQKAVFGEASYEFGKVKLTAGGRYYDFNETRDFISGGLFANGDRRIGDKTKSNGFSPRAILSFEPNRNLSFNVQAAKGFRLGGVNDPLNLPLCSAADRALFGGFQNYDDESLWNYEGGVKYQPRPGDLQRRGLLHRHQEPAGDARRRQLLEPRRVQRRQGPHPRRRSRIQRPAIRWLRPELRRQPARTPSSTPRCPASAARAATGIRDGNRLPTRAEIPVRHLGHLRQPIQRHAEWYVTGKLAAGRQPLHPARRPGKQPAHLRLRPALQRRHRDRSDPRQPAASGL